MERGTEPPPSIVITNRKSEHHSTWTTFITAFITTLTRHGFYAPGVIPPPPNTRNRTPAHVVSRHRGKPHHGITDRHINEDMHHRITHDHYPSLLPKQILCRYASHPDCPIYMNEHNQIHTSHAPAATPSHRDSTPTVS